MAGNVGDDPYVDPTLNFPDVDFTQFSDVLKDSVIVTKNFASVSRITIPVNIPFHTTLAVLSVHELVEDGLRPIKDPDYKFNINGELEFAFGKIATGQIVIGLYS